MIETDQRVGKDTQQDLPAGWRWVRLGDVCDAQSGGTPSRGRPDYYGGNIPWAKIEDLTRSGMYIDDTEEHLSQAGLDGSAARIFPSGTLLFAMYGSIGTTSIARSPLATNQAILGCRCSSSLLPEFLWFWFSLIREDLSRMGRGGTQANLNAAIVKNLSIPLPPLPEQRRIAAILAEQMAAVERARAAAEAQLAAAKALPAAYLRAVFESDGAREWPRVRMGDICSAIRGVTFASGEATGISQAETIACLTTSGVQSTVAWESSCFIPSRRVQDNSQMLMPGDLLVSTANSKALVGKSCFVESLPFPCTFGAFVTVLRAKPSVIPQYLAHWMRSPEVLAFCYQMSSNTTNISNLRVSDLLEILIPSPPLTEQKQISSCLAEQLAAVERTRDVLQQQLDAMNALPAALLRQAFNGEL